MNLQVEINKLDLKQKVELVNQVLLSIDNESDTNFESEWLELANKRLNNSDDSEYVPLSKIQEELL